MSSHEFDDYYELLQLSPNADAETIERVFRISPRSTIPTTPTVLTMAASCRSSRLTGRSQILRPVPVTT